MSAYIDSDECLIPRFKILKSFDLSSQKVSSQIDTNVIYLFLYSSYLFYSSCIQAIYSILPVFKLFILLFLYSSYLLYSPCIQTIYSILPVFKLFILFPLYSSYLLYFPCIKLFILFFLYSSYLFYSSCI